MRIFICWSGDRARELARVLRGWLPKVVESVEPFFSEEIPSGRVWRETLSRKLRESTAGLVCVTPESVDAAWPLFEAGALANADRPIYTYLYNVAPERLPAPLSVFQSNKATYDGTLALVETMSHDSRLDTTQLTARFEEAWPDLDTVLHRLKAISIEAAVPGFRDLFEHKTFLEPLDECSDCRWSDRLERLAGVLALLDERKEEFEALGFENEYNALRHHLDDYALNVKTELLTPTEFSRVGGRLQIDVGILARLENPRNEIRELVERLAPRTPR